MQLAIRSPAAAGRLSRPCKARHLEVTCSQRSEQAKRKQRSPQSQEKPKKERRPPMPESGFFAQADTKAEVYSPLGGVSNPDADFTKRGGGRYAPDFIWNTNWQAQLQYQESLKRIKERAAERAEQGDLEDAPAGAISFGRKALLNSMDVDLSAQLRPRKKPGVDSSADKASTPGRKQKQRQRPVSRQFVMRPPSKGEARRWSRGGKFSRRVVAVAPTNEAEDAELAAQRAAEKKRYDQLKEELMLWTLATGGALFVATWAFYTRDTAISYGVGAAGGLFYLRLLNRSVEGFGGTFGAVVGQQRLLIPVILALGYNRWNTLAADELGVQLALLPMLLGFFTYKGAVVARSSLALWDELTAGLKSPEQQAAEGGQQQQQGEEEEGGGSSGADSFQDPLPVMGMASAAAGQQQQWGTGAEAGNGGGAGAAAAAGSGGVTLSPEDIKRLDRDYREKILTRI